MLSLDVKKHHSPECRSRGTYPLRDKLSDLGRDSIHGQIQHLLMEICLSMEKMEQIQEASVIIITLSCDTYTRTEAGKGKS